MAVGGDGTASEVIDGLAGAVGSPALEVGFIPHGTGGDLRRSLGLSEDVAAAARALACPESRLIDLGRAELVGPDGGPLVRHFVNVATCGVSAVVAGHVNAGRRFGSGKLTFFVASARAMLTWHDRTAFPSISTVHAPQSPVPQPYLVPVRFDASRSAHSKGVCGSSS